MKLNDQQADRIIARLKEKIGGEPECNICRRKDTIRLLGIVTEQRTFQKGSLSVGGTIMPILSLCCDHCGGVMMLLAMDYLNISHDSDDE